MNAQKTSINKNAAKTPLVEKASDNYISRIHVTGINTPINSHTQLNQLNQYNSINILRKLEIVLTTLLGSLPCDGI